MDKTPPQLNKHRRTTGHHIQNKGGPVLVLPRRAHVTATGSRCAAEAASGTLQAQRGAGRREEASAALRARTRAGVAVPARAATRARRLQQECVICATRDSDGEGN